MNTLGFHTAAPLSAKTTLRFGRQATPEEIEQFAKTENNSPDSYNPAFCFISETSQENVSDRNQLMMAFLTQAIVDLSRSVVSLLSWNPPAEAVHTSKGLGFRMSREEFEKRIAEKEQPGQDSQAAS
jgi:hypothetical protein